MVVDSNTVEIMTEVHYMYLTKFCELFACLAVLQVWGIEIYVGNLHVCLIIWLQHLKHLL